MTYATPIIFPNEPTGRAGRSRALIQERFSSRLVHSAFAHITMSELADDCGLSRSTLYRAFANTTEILWAVVCPHLDTAVSAALNADKTRFVQSFDTMCSITGLRDALVSHAARGLREKFATLATARAERIARRRQARGFGTIISGAWFGALEALPLAAEENDEVLSDLYNLTYMSAFLTPRGVGRLVRRPAVGLSGRFPAAVSVAESLANHDYIISMIDGRQYRTLSRHLARFGMSPEDYRRCFDLPYDYPMVAPGYSAVRRQLARKSIRGNEKEEYARDRAHGPG